jgi:uncharacterized protein YndB with AHSA1/START domain
MTATTTIEHVVDIDASPDTVFELWTTPSGLGRWWATSAECDPRPGGAIRVVIDAEHVLVGEFLEVDRPHHLRFSFGWQGGLPAPGSTEVDVRIVAAGSGTRLTLRHHGLPIELIEAHARGWTHFVGERMTEISETP